MSGHPDFPQPRGRELSDEEARELVHAAFDCERRVKERIAQVHADTWELAEALYEFHELHGWKLVGYETLSEFLAQPDVGLSHTQYFRLAKMWRDLVVVQRIAPARLKGIEPSKVSEVVPAVMRGDVGPQDALDDAEALGWRDLREKYCGSPSAGTLAAETEPVRVKCPTCQQWTTEEVIEGTAREVAPNRALSAGGES